MWDCWAFCLCQERLKWFLTPIHLRPTKILPQCCHIIQIPRGKTCYLLKQKSVSTKLTEFLSFFPLGIAFWVLTFREHLLSPLFGRDGGRAAWWVSRLTLSQPSTASSVMVLFIDDTQSLAACCPSAELVLYTSFYYSECYWINYIKTTSPVTLRKSYFQQRIFLHLCSDLMNACTLSLFSYCFTFLHARPWWELIISLIVCRNIYALHFFEHYCTRYL